MTDSKGNEKEKEKGDVGVPQATDARLSAASRFATAAIRNVGGKAEASKGRRQRRILSRRRIVSRHAYARHACARAHTHARESQHANNTPGVNGGSGDEIRRVDAK